MKCVYMNYNSIEIVPTKYDVEMHVWYVLKLGAVGAGVTHGYNYVKTCFLLI